MTDTPVQVRKPRKLAKDNNDATSAVVNDLYFPPDNPATQVDVSNTKKRKEKQRSVVKEKKKEEAAYSSQKRKGIDTATPHQRQSSLDRKVVAPKVDDKIVNRQNDGKICLGANSEKKTKVKKSQTIDSAWNQSKQAELPTTHHSEGDTAAEKVENQKAFFQQAAAYINPGMFFRFVVNWYGERKLIVFFWLHFVATMVIWLHFALVKWDEQKNTVPAMAPNYWWKRIAPALEFGSMHAILFQMALIPLTMSRFSIVALSESVVDRFIPLNRMVRVHIHLGYVMIGIVFLAVCFFFLFFGLLCSRGEQDFCERFTSEMMITGYLILGFLLIVGATSYFRYCIPYEIFYGIHHLVFIMYVATILHTFDDVERNDGRKRSQTFKWFSSTLLYYACDRIAMHMNHRYRTKIMSLVTINSLDGSRMLLLKVRRPVLFQFKPGQYASIKIPDINNEWHPFSIASGPSSSHLEFYIEVFGPKTWTGQLWTRVGGDGNGCKNMEIAIEIMGPYGTSFGANTGDYSHGIAIGAGTGIVPVVALFQEHVRELLRLSPDVHFRLAKETREKRTQYELARDLRKGSIAQQIADRCIRKSNSVAQTNASNETRKDVRRKTIESNLQEFTGVFSDQKNNFKVLSRTSKELRRAAFRVTKSIYGVVLIGALTIYGIVILGLSLSWNTIPIPLYEGMSALLQLLTWIFQVLFAITAICVWDGDQFLAYIDTVICLVCFPADYFWFQEYERNNTLGATSTTLLAMLISYMTFRLWMKAVGRRHTSWRNASEQTCTGPLERLEVIWVTRSAPLIAKILPDINRQWERLVRQWGNENAQKVCRFTVYCTDKDKRALNGLLSEISSSSLYKQGFVHFGRPNFEEIIQNHTLSLIEHGRSSSSLLAFCGSPALAQTIHRFKLSNDMTAAIVGHKEHQMDFVSESYGGIRTGKKTASYFSIFSEKTSRSYEFEVDKHKSLHSSEEAPSVSHRRLTFYQEYEDLPTDL